MTSSTMWMRCFYYDMAKAHEVGVDYHFGCPVISADQAR